MELEELTALSPLDGRYRKHTAAVAESCSEFGFIRHRLLVEVEYFIALSELGLPELPPIPAKAQKALRKLWRKLTPEDAAEIKKIEKTTNHDVKALEYFLKKRLKKILAANDYPVEKIEFVHFGLTSQDINNTAQPLMLRQVLLTVWMPELEALHNRLSELAEQWAEVPLLARTHGQAASPTTFGKELAVFADRISAMYDQLLIQTIPAKFGGATGNFNAHKAAYPTVDWLAFADKFVNEQLNDALIEDLEDKDAVGSLLLLSIQRTRLTTQIDTYDGLAVIFDCLRRVNVVLVDLCRDLWTYISMDHLRQVPVAGEVGSSAMPHKVNPIDFENAEGNLLLANALFDFMSNKLPVSRLQRDLTDSTVLRNFGVPIGHTVLAFNSIRKGLKKIDLRPEHLAAELEANWAVVAEGIQTILRRVGYPEPYEALKALTRTGQTVSKRTMHAFIAGLDVAPAVKRELRALSPATYTGYAAQLAQRTADDDYMHDSDFQELVEGAEAIA
jgi:adenylosuccinate lyase